MKKCIFFTLTRKAYGWHTFFYNYRLSYWRTWWRLFSSKRKFSQ